MIVLGLAGKASSGKDTVADYLVSRYGFVKFSFSDALYREVTEAFGLEDESLLRDRATKEQYSDLLALKNCADDEFLLAVARYIDGPLEDLNMDGPQSPREILQIWGTEYRRAQDPDYWIKQAQDWVHRVHHFHPYPELKPQYFVNTSVRFPNEQEWVHLFEGGNCWHLHRDGIAPVHAHESETPLLVLPGERQIWNNSSIDHLHRAVDLLLSTNTPTVRCEPMKPMTEPEEQS